MSNTDPKHIQRMMDYHHWASDRVHEALGDVSAAELDKPMGGSFGTARALLRHVVGVEGLWLARWLGSSPTALPEFPATYAAKDFRAEWEKSKAKQVDFARGATADKLGGKLNYKNFKGEDISLVLGDTMAHVVNHGSYHRGQLTHLLRELGRKPADTDFFVYLRLGK
jgi:uncharacterized damage-inducible protein DinB